MHTQKFRHREFLVKIDPGKTRKWKTSERGGFYYLELRYDNDHVQQLKYKLVSFYVHHKQL
jgi:hypothetical protein